MEELVERSQPVRVFGKFRNVGARDANLLCAAVRLTWRRDCGGGVPESIISNLLRLKVDDDHWKSCLGNLVDWGLIELAPAERGDARRLKVTTEGRGWAIDLCGLRQLDRKPVDGIDFEER